MTKIFIDGKDGTTGLKIFSRFEKRNDIELLLIDEAKRKDPSERAKMILESDITFLCLPDEAAKEAVLLAGENDVKIIDTSTAHRTSSGWAYGFPELSDAHRENIIKSNRIAVPGCYASGFNAIVYPLVEHGFIKANHPLVCYALSGYSGAGKNGIAQYENPKRDKELDSPRLYALTQEHKHLKEMDCVCKLERTPIFSPIICDYPQGMVVCVPLFTAGMEEKYTLSDFYTMFESHYSDSPIVKVRKPGYTKGMIGTNRFADRDDMEIEISGNDERILLTARFDNLGKGASGAAIQCMNILMGIDEKTGLNLGD